MYILTNGVIAIGPFWTIEQAEEYRNKNKKYYRQYKTMEVLSPVNR